MESVAPKQIGLESLLPLGKEVRKSAESIKLLQRILAEDIEGYKDETNTKFEDVREAIDVIVNRLAVFLNDMHLIERSLESNGEGMVLSATAALERLAAYDRDRNGIKPSERVQGALETLRKFVNENGILFAKEHREQPTATLIKIADSVQKIADAASLAKEIMPAESKGITCGV